MVGNPAFRKEKKHGPPVCPLANNNKTIDRQSTVIITSLPPRAKSLACSQCCFSIQYSLLLYLWTELVFVLCKYLMIWLDYDVLNLNDNDVCVCWF